MPGLNRIREAIERHRENKDINLKYKTPLTIRNINTFVDEQNIEDACNPVLFDRKVRIHSWVCGVQRVSLDSETSSLATNAEH